MSKSENPSSELNLGFDQRTLKSRSVRGAAAIFVAQAAKFVIRFGATIILARLLAPADFGLIAMVAPIVALAQMLNDAGLTQAIVQREDISTGQISALFWVMLAVSLAIACLLLAAAPVVSLIYSEPATTGILTALSALVVIAAAGMVPTALLTRRILFLPLAMIDVSCSIASTGVSLTAAWLGYGYWSLVYGQIAASVLNLLLVFSAAGWLPQRPGRLAEVGSLVRFGASLTGSNIASYLMSTADNMIVGAVVGKSGLGIYDRSYSLVVQPLGQVISPIGRVAIPLLSRLSNNPAVYRDTFTNMLKICLLLTTPGMIFSIIFAEPAILYVLGEKWRAAIPVFAWLCVGGLVVPLFLASTWAFVSQGRVTGQLRYTVLTSIISVISFAVGVIWGIQGVAIVSAISFAFIQTPIIIWGATRSGAVKLRDVASATAPVAAAALTTSGLLLLLPRTPGLLGLGAALALSYAALAFFVYLLPGGRQLFKALVRMRSVFQTSAA